MELKIIERKRNPLLHREEIRFSLEGAKESPSRKDVRARIAAQVGAEESLVFVDRMRPSFGSPRVEGSAKRYDTQEDLARTESVYMKRRHGEGEASPAGEDAPEAAKSPSEGEKPVVEGTPEGKALEDEKPAEEKKEEGA